MFYMYDLLHDRCIWKILLFFSWFSYLNNRILSGLLLRVMGCKEGQIDVVMLVYLLSVINSTYVYGILNVVWIFFIILFIKLITVLYSILVYYYNCCHYIYIHIYK